MIRFIAFFFITGLLIANNCPAHASTGTWLTGGFESAYTGMEDEYGHSIWHYWAMLQGYNRFDQCQRQPDRASIMSFTLMLRLTEQFMNDGKGLTICYLGQLDGQNEAMGATIGVNQQINNEMGNALNDTCELARAKLWRECEKASLMIREECHAFTQYPWHGIRFAIDRNGHDLQMTMSITNNSFLIPRAGFKNGHLFYKLTTWDHYTASFSKIIGPGKQDWHFDWREEHRNLVNIEEDAAFREEFWKNGPRGAHLDKYLGPWALAPDLLPRFDESPINLFIMRSECSEMGAMFLFPFDENIDDFPQYAPPNQLPFFVDQFMLYANSTVTIRGSVQQKAEHFAVIFVMLVEPDKIRSITLAATFSDNSAYAELMVAKKFEDTDWTDSRPSEPIKFTKGNQFRLKIIIGTNNLRASLNCGPYVEYDIGTEIPPINHVKLKIDGHIDLYSSNYTFAPISLAGKYVDTFNVDIYPVDSFPSGILIRGGIQKDWRKISIEFYNIDEFAFEKQKVLDFEAENGKPQMEFISYQVNKRVVLMQKNIGTLLPIIEVAGYAYVEFHFSFNETHANVTLNNLQLCTIPVQLGISFIKIEADFEFLGNERTRTARIGGPLLIAPYNDYIFLPHGKSVTIRGKVQPYAWEFGIYLLNDMTKQGCNNAISSVSCGVALSIETDFGRGITKVGSSMMKRDGPGDSIVTQYGQIYTFPAAFEPGKDFLVRMRLVDDHNLNVTFTSGDDLMGDFGLIQTISSQTNLASIYGDVLVFGIMNVE